MFRFLPTGDLEKLYPSSRRTNLLAIFTDIENDISILEGNELEDLVIRYIARGVEIYKDTFKRTTIYRLYTKTRFNRGIGREYIFLDN